MNKLNSTQWIIIIFGTIVFIGLAILVYLVGTGIIHYCKMEYEMPDKVICYSSIITGGGFGGATHEFQKCENDKIYVNPEYYKKIEVCKK